MWSVNQNVLRAPPPRLAKKIEKLLSPFPACFVIFEKKDNYWQRLKSNKSINAAVSIHTCLQADRPDDVFITVLDYFPKIKICTQKSLLWTGVENQNLYKHTKYNNLVLLM